MVINNIGSIGSQATDIKVLGRVVSISTSGANGALGTLAEAVQVWDSGFNKLGVQNGANQNYINDLISGKIADMIAAGLLPEGGAISIKYPTTFTQPVSFNGNITLGNGVTVGPNFSVTGNVSAGNNITASHTITGNDIVSNGSISGVTLTTSGNATIGGNETVTGKLTVNGGADIHGAFKAFDGATFDGNTTVNNLTVNGTFDAPHATTTRYGIVRLATGLTSNADDDVVPVSLFRTHFQQLLNNPNTAAIDSIAELLDKINANEALVPSKLNDLSDVNSSNTPSAGDILYYNGSAWVNTSFQTLFDNAIASYLNTINGNISGASLWQVSGNYLIPKDTTKNVATTTGKIYSGITL